MRVFQNQKIRGFTLVELLVVITIIGILVGLGTGVALFVRVGAVEATTKTQLSQMEMALEAYKGEFGEYPPMLSDEAGVMRHAASRWKRANITYADIEAAVTADNSTALTFWLGGRYNRATESYIGFSADLEDPLNPDTKQRIEPRFDFSDKNTVAITGGRYFADTISRKPVAYFRSTSLGDTFAYLHKPDATGRIFPFCDAKVGNFGDAVPYAKSVNDPNGVLSDPDFGWTKAEWDQVTVVWHGAKKFQLIHPGRNDEFGTPDPKIVYFTGKGYNISLDAEDNITNFTSTATLKGELD